MEACIKILIKVMEGYKKYLVKFFGNIKKTALMTFFLKFKTRTLVPN